MHTLINGVLTEVNKPESLSEQRKNSAFRRKNKTIYSKENTESNSDNIVSESTLIVPPEEATEDIGDSEERSEESEDEPERSEEKYFGKDVVVKPLAYYTLDESLKHSLNDYREQIKRTTNLVMAKRAKWGQRVATERDKQDVLGEYPEKNTSETIVNDDFTTGPGLILKRHYFTRPISGIMYRITIDEAKTGIGQTRRNNYMLVDIAVIFYRKNGVGLGKEIILRSKVLRFRKRAPHPNAS
jgi:hypothetical protein